MVIFHFPQFEHELFWQYLSKVNDYHAQYVHFTYERWEICDAVLEEITYQLWVVLKSVCYGGLCSLDVDDMCNLFESLASCQWQCECASEAFVCPSPYDVHAQSPCVDQSRDLCNHHSSYPLGVCSHCQSFKHHVDYCPYHDVSDESYWCI